MDHISDWTLNGLAEADRQGRVEMLSCSVDEARWLIDYIPENNATDELAQYLDQAQGDAKTDGGCRYLILRIGE